MVVVARSPTHFSNLLSECMTAGWTWGSHCTGLGLARAHAAVAGQIEGSNSMAFKTRVVCIDGEAGAGLERLGQWRPVW